MTLRPEYSLGHSQYNDFLFAEVGEEKDGVQLTVLSALTRLGVDPWQEAARLSDLPRDAAARALAATIARLPPGDWSPGGTRESDLGAIATSLVAILPKQSAPLIPTLGSGRQAAADGARKGQRKSESESKRNTMKVGFPTWLIWGAVAVAFYLLIVQMTPDQNFEPTSQESTTQQ